MKTHLIPALLLAALLGTAAGSCRRGPKDYWKDVEEPETPAKKPVEKPRFIWIDAAANFPDFADSREHIARDLALAKETGFTDIVVDVRPTSGEVLFKTSAPYAGELRSVHAWVGGEYRKVSRTATWDYLQAFIDEGHRLGLRVHAALNVFVGGRTEDGGTGMLYRHKELRDWAASVYAGGRVVNVMDTPEDVKFLNPAHPEVQDFLCALLRDLARYEIDGIFLDRARYTGLSAEFSDLSLRQFEAFNGGVGIGGSPEGLVKSLKGRKFTPLARKWLAFRAHVIHDFMAKARDAVKEVRPEIRFGVYVGGWYSTYYEFGVNWAASSYDASRHFSWACSDYRGYGFADLMDQMLIGAYASPLQVYGTQEWTMQGFCTLAMDKIRGKCPLVAGGPDVGNWDAADKATPEQENEAIVRSVKACMDACDGYFLFDMIHLKHADQWRYAAQGIAAALGK